MKFIEKKGLYDDDDVNKLWIEVRFPKRALKAQVMGVEVEIKRAMAKRFREYAEDSMVSVWDDKGSRIW